MKQASNMWFSNAKIVNAINLCMEMIAKAGLTESDAEYVPACLYQAIKASNQISMGRAAFSPQKFEVEEEDGGYKITPPELGPLLFQ